MRKLDLVGLAMLLVGACGDDGVNRLPDGPPGIDASPGIDAAVLPVTLTVTTDGVPRMGVKVYFQNADSSLVSAVDTDASGVASAIMVTGGYVTAVNPFPRRMPTLVFGDELKTFAGVKPGDQLVLKDSQSSTFVDFTLELPIDPAANYYYAYTTCGDLYVPASAGSGAGPSSAATLYGCPSATIDALVISYLSNGQPSQSFYQTGITVAADQIVTLTGTYGALAQASFEYTNVPAQFNYVDLAYSRASTAGVLAKRDYGNNSVTAGAVTTTLTLAPTTDTIGIQQINPYAEASTLGDHYIIAWGPESATNTFDLADVTLHDFLTDPSFDAATTSVNWTAATTGAVPDLSIVSLNLNRMSPIPDGGQNNEYWNWDIVAPYGTTSIKFPTLPADGAIYNPTATDSVYFYGLATAKVPGGYDQVRANVLSIGNPTDFVVGPTGQVVYEEFYQDVPKVRASPTARSRSIFDVQSRPKQRARR